jgi:hypothetical protein
MRRALPWLLAVAGLAYALRGFRGFPAGGRTVPAPRLGPMPAQEALDPPQEIEIVRDGATYRVRKTHRYRVIGQVVSVATYTLTFANDFFDVDLGLAWGDHVEALIRRYTFHQDHRWLFWRSDTPVSDAERLDVTTHVGNQHVIPASDNLDRAVRRARVGERVVLEGYLATVLTLDGIELATSSTRRDDTGAGACEIVWVESFQRETKRWNATGSRARPGDG